MKALQLPFLVLIGLLLQLSGYAQTGYTIPEKPSLQTSVYDYAQVLDSNQQKQFEEKLIKYSDSTSTQIVYVSINSLQGSDIAQLATQWAHKWGIGDEKKDNGILILLSKDDRKIYIVNGYGVDDRLTAGVTGSIIRQVIIPEFKTGNYYSGLDKGTDAIIEALKGKYKAPAKQSEGISSMAIILLIFLIIILFIVLSRRGKGNSGGFGGGIDLSDIIILSSMGRGGGGFGGFSGGSGGGGGFSGGFGGGGFSGGGAGGSW